MKSITIIENDRVGLLADISYILGKARINIESISVDVIGNKALVRLIVKDAKETKDVLEMNKFHVSEENATILKLPDQPGELSRITSLLAKDKIDIKNVHIISRNGKETILSIVTDKPKKTEVILKDILASHED